ncbi:hypothetical protein PANDA_014525, partial [Ailuropoda melanoleuca]
AGCWELVNTWCSPVTLTAHLRQRGKVPQDAIIALLAEDGHLVSLDEGLEEGASQAPSMGSPLLQERGTYVLVQIISNQELVFLPPQRGRVGPPPAMSPYWRTWMTSIQSWQRSFTTCQAYTPRVTAGRGARALGVATRSKAPFQGHE